MASFNKVFLLGNLTRDPELRVAANGNPICKFGLATSRHYTTPDGTQHEDTTFVSIDAFGRQAEVLAKYMSKGRPIFIEGRLKFDQWETQMGEKRSKLGVVLESFQFIGSRQDNEAQMSDQRPGPSYEEVAPPPRFSPSANIAPPAAPVDPVQENKVTVPESDNDELPF